MFRKLISVIVLLGVFHFDYALSADRDRSVPEIFQRFDATSTHTIKYADLDQVLDVSVTDVGRSTREKAAPTQAKTGTRMKTSVKRSTINEGNRFQYEAFHGSEELTQMLKDIRASLERIPSDVPLEYFNRNEQLAYWLNLYNFTVINEILAIYPKRNLKKVLVGKKSILDKKLLNVAGHSLSLNDIQFGILRQNYDNDPLVMYGLYQGNIGGPNIRKRAYTGANVQRYLQNNAAEFINSNRGTYAENESVFRVSSLYERNESYFDDFEKDLTEHLMAFIQGEERGFLASTERIKPNIDDWTITDLYGTFNQIGGSFADNRAALVDSVQNVQVGENPSDTFSGNLSASSSMVMSKGVSLGRFNPDLVVQLQELKVKESAANMEKGTVTVEELYAPYDPDAEVETTEEEEPEQEEDR